VRDEPVEHLVPIVEELVVGLWLTVRDYAARYPVPIIGR